MPQQFDTIKANETVTFRKEPVFRNRRSILGMFIVIIGIMIFVTGIVMIVVNKEVIVLIASLPVLILGILIGRKSRQEDN